jgi:DNA-binding response OmpR family regulator
MRPTLLLAERNPELRHFYQRFITSRGYEVETAADGLECLAKLRRAMPAAVVLDLELCWGGGHGVLAWLREERTTSKVPVILTATAGYPADDTQVLEPPVIRFLVKPVAATVLLETVRSAVAGAGSAPRKAGQDDALTELFLG